MFQITSCPSTFGQVSPDKNRPRTGSPSKRASMGVSEELKMISWRIFLEFLEIFPSGYRKRVQMNVVAHSPEFHIVT